MTPWWTWIPPGLACAYIGWQALAVLRRSLRRASAVVAEAQKPPARQETSPPAAPGTRTPRIHPRHGRHLLTARFYTGGSVIWDAQGRKIAEFCEPVPDDQAWDEWAAKLWEQK